jgi:hypothetical protein
MSLMLVLDLEFVNSDNPRVVGHNVGFNRRVSAIHGMNPIASPFHHPPCLMRRPLQHGQSKVQYSLEVYLRLLPQ